MTTQQLNEYIKHYVKDNKTKSAIMLSGPWGSGKSHYIKQELEPYLRGCDVKCVIVSLYGLKSVYEVSKSIYIEFRAKFLQSESEAATAGKLIAKTVFKGVTSYFGVDLSCTESEMQSLFESIELSDKLIVLEDVERSQIDVIELLGYINNLVEQDSAKVLVVANEEELIEYEEITNEKDDSDTKLIEKSQKYIKTKEKTISDTVFFEGDYFNAIRNIIQLFGENGLGCFLKDEYIHGIVNLLQFSGNRNLRSFIYACQKTSDILGSLKVNIDIDKKQSIFYSIIIFSSKVKEDTFPKWEGSKFLSVELGNENYPLYRFCYDYIRWQQVDFIGVEETFEAHNKMKLYQHHTNDKDLLVLYNCFCCAEKDVLNSLENIDNKLDDPFIIPFYEYSKLANSLIICRTVLDYDYTPLKIKMVNNIKEKGSDLDKTVLFLPFGDFISEVEAQLYEEFKNELISAIEESQNNEIEIDYSREKISEYYRYVVDNSMKIRSKHIFISNFNFEKLMSMIWTCSSSQIHDIRGILFAIYRGAHKGSFDEKDIEMMNRVKDAISKRLGEADFVCDRIVKLQLRWLCGNLKDFIQQLS
ncbi:MAG: P-loop NTPase fold protein [Acutalibacteraceae bacterium]|nr:P-loop NTPase fold protein [Acutalibacteraceae bacterium]